jgi:hypothetical protein
MTDYPRDKSRYNPKQEHVKIRIISHQRSKCEDHCRKNHLTGVVKLTDVNGVEIEFGRGYSMSDRQFTNLNDHAITFHKDLNSFCKYECRDW